MTILAKIINQGVEDAQKWKLFDPFLTL